MRARLLLCYYYRGEHNAIAAKHACRRRVHKRRQEV